MKSLSTIITTLAAAAMLSSSAYAQQAAGIFDVRPGMTKSEFTAMTAELGSALRFRQVTDPRTIGRGEVDLSVEFANTAIDDRVTDRSMPFPRAAARFGVSDRLDIGVWGGYDSGAKYGVAGLGTTIAVLRQDDDMPVSISIRPSVTSLIGPSELWIGNASIDVTASRQIGSFVPYVGAAASGSLGVERSAQVSLDPVVADHSVSYAGVAYRWRALSLAAEVEKGARVTYGLRVGTRF